MRALLSEGGGSSSGKHRSNKRRVGNESAFGANGRGGRSGGGDYNAVCRRKEENRETSSIGGASYLGSGTAYGISM